MTNIMHEVHHHCVTEYQREYQDFDQETRSLRRELENEISKRNKEIESITKTHKQELDTCHARTDEVVRRLEKLTKKKVVFN
jgi:ribosome recycling factor